MYLKCTIDHPIKTLMTNFKIRLIILASKSLTIRHWESKVNTLSMLNLAKLKNTHVCRINAKSCWKSSWSSCFHSKIPAFWELEQVRSARLWWTPGKVGNKFGDGEELDRRPTLPSCSIHTMTWSLTISAEEGFNTSI